MRQQIKSLKYIGNFIIASNVLNEFKKLVEEEAAISIKDEDWREKSEDIANRSVVIKKPLLVEFTKRIIDELQGLKDKGTEETGIFLGSFSYNMDEDFSKEIFNKTYPSWTMKFDDLVSGVSREFKKKYKMSRGYKACYKKAFETVYGKGSFKRAEDANKKN